MEYLDLGLFFWSGERDYHGLCRPQGVPAIGLLGTIQWTDTAAVDWVRGGEAGKAIVDRRSVVGRQPPAHPGSWPDNSKSGFTKNSHFF